MPDNYTGRHYSLDPEPGDDEITQLVNQQLARGRNGGIHGSGPDPCPNPEHSATWHGAPQAIHQRWSGTETGTCPGSFYFNDDGTPRNP